MNKINLCVSEADFVSDFSNVSVSEIDTLINGSVENINIAILNSLDYDVSTDILVKSLKKLKNKGTLTIEIVDILGVAKEAFLGSTTSKSISNALSNKKSFLYEHEITDIIHNFPQFKVKNKYKENNNIIIVVYKELDNA